MHKGIAGGGGRTLPVPVWLSWPFSIFHSRDAAVPAVQLTLYQSQIVGSEVRLTCVKNDLWDIITAPLPSPSFLG